MNGFEKAPHNSQNSLAQQKQALLKLLLQKKGIHVEQKATIPRRPPTARNCVSFAQQRLWFLAQLEGASLAYNMPALLRLKGNLSVTSLQRSLEAIVQRHEILRTTFKPVEGVPVQVIASNLDITLPVVDLQTLSVDEQHKEIQRWIVELTQAPFDLENGPLLRTHLLKLQPQEHLLVLTLHHIIFDGWSIAVFVRELSALYSGFLQGGAVTLPELPVQYADFAHWQQQWLRGEVLDRQLQYWQRQLYGLNGASLLDLPTDYPRPAIQTYQGAKYSFALPNSLAQSLKQLSQDRGATLFMTFLGAFAVLMGRYSGQEDIVIGSPIANRNRSELEHSIGFFVNTLALRVNLEGNPTFVELLAQVKETAMQAYAHQDLPFEMLVEKLKLERNLSYNPLFQVMFALQNAPTEDLKLPGLTIEQEEIDSGTSHFDLSFHLWDREEGLQGFVTYRTDLFESMTVVKMVDRLQQLLEAIAVDPNQRLSQFSFLSAAEQQQLFGYGRVAEARRSSQMLDPSPVLHQLWDAQVASQPEAIAIVSQHQSLTYDALNRQANQFAGYLRTLGIQPGAAIGIYVESSLQLIPAVLGVLKVGGTIVYLDPAETQDRFAKLCHQVQPAAILVQDRDFDGRSLPENVAESCQIVNLEDEAISQQASNPPNVAIDPTHLAQILDASNRLVQVTHQSICQRIVQLQAQFPLKATDVCLSAVPLSQETGLLEMFWTLMVGGRLILPTIEERQTASKLRHLIEEESVSVLHAWTEWLSDWGRELERDTAELDAPSALRWVFYRGTTSSVVSQIQQSCGAAIAHLYSLPEAGVVAACDTQPNSPENHQFSVGYRACQPLLILDRHLQPVPVGVRGEIYVGGSGLAQGYRQNCAETAHRFRQLPFPHPNHSNTPWFKTGRTGKWLPDGRLQLLDSGDRQAVIQGFHISLREIEAVLLANSAVRDCRVLVRETDGDRSELVAYVVPSERLSLEQLRHQVQAVLPSHLEPKSYLLLSALPMKTSGEIDDSALLKYPTIEPELARCWEEGLSSLPGVEQLAVVIREKSSPLPRLPLPELLPESFIPPSDTAYTEPVLHPPCDPREKSANLSSRPLAISDGGPLTIPEAAPMTLTEALIATATHYGDREMVFIQSEGSPVRQSYRDLLEEAKCKLAGLSDHGLKAGDRVILQIVTLRDYFSTFWACILGGIVPVTVAVAPTYDRHNVVVEKLLKVWELLDRPTILASDALVEPIARLFEATSAPSPSIAINRLSQYPPTPKIHPSCPDDVVFLQLTSGSTGRSKAVQETHRGIIAHIHAAAQFNGYQSCDISLNWLPLDHVVPILTCHFKDVYLGCQQIEVPTTLILNDPLKWLDLLESEGVTHTWSPNFGYKLVSQALQNRKNRHWNLTSMKFFMNAGEQVTRSIVQEFLEKMAPFGVSPRMMQPAFGMAEVCTCMTYQNEFSLDSTSVHRIRKTSLGGTLQFTNATDETVSEFVDLGPPVPGVQIRIVNTDNQVLPEGTIGQLQIEGTVVTPGYLDNPDANRDAFVGSGWFNTGDLGFILNGRLTLTGREKEQIVVRGVNYYCYEIEDIVHEIEGVKPTYVAACGVENADLGTEELAIFFVPNTDVDRSELIQEIKTRVTTHSGIAPAAIVPLTPSEFPKTTSGKIQRQRLKGQLQAGELDDRLQSVDRLLSTENTLPSWFYRKIWQRRQVGVIHPPQQNGPYLIFLDSLGLGESLCKRLQQAGQTVIGVEARQAFDRLDETRYCIDPNQPDGYRRLLESLAAKEIPIQQVIHLWNYESHEDSLGSPSDWATIQERGLDCLMLLVQALATVQGGRHSVRLQAISNQTQAVAPDDRVSPAKASTLGLLKTISQEYPWISTSHLDLPIQSLAINGDRILWECQVRNKDQEIAYRGQQRWVARLERVDVTQTQKQPLPFKAGGLYLLSGGLGGIGVEIAKFLLDRYQAHLILVGRTPLEGQSETQDDRLQVYQELQQLGGSCHYEAVDVGNLEQLQQVVDRAGAQRPLDGIVHLAGVSREMLLQDETPEGLAAALYPKAAGTWALHQLLQPKNDPIFISFSSVNGFFGGFTVGAYAAANCFLEAFAQEQRRQGIRSYCWAWSRWDGVGMSRNAQAREQAQSRGYCSLTPKQGIQSLLVAAQHDSMPLWIGLDDGIPNVRQHLATSPQPLQQFAAFFTGQPDAIRGKLAEWVVCDRLGLPTSCQSVHLPEMPRTETGDIDREQLVRWENLYSETAKTRTAPRTEVEQQVAQVWQEILSASAVGVEDNFFTLGGHSLLATQLVFRLGQLFEIDLSIQTVFEHPTLGQLSAAIETLRSQADCADTVAPMHPVPRDGHLPLSFAQQRLWFLDRLEDSNTATYNMPTALQLTGDLQIDVLEQSINEILRRHEVLRTTFPVVDGVPVQAIAPESTLTIASMDLRHLAPEQQQTEVRRLALEEAHRPFDLLQGPLLRVTLLKLGERAHVLLVTIHHICSDGWSVALYTHELSVLYPAFSTGQPSPLVDLPIQYADFAAWQHQQMTSDRLQSQLAYWQEQLRGAPPLLKLPIDYPRSSVQSFRGQALPVKIDSTLTQQLTQISSEVGATLFMGLLAVFFVVLHYESGQDDLVIGTDVANRNRAETEHLIGFFVNQLSLRLDLGNNPAFNSELLSRVKTRSLEAYAHQDLPFDRLVEHLKIERSLSYNPVFQAKLVLQNTPPANLELPGLTIERLEIEHQMASYDLLLNLEESESGLVGCLRYSSDLFQETTIARIIKHFQTVLQAVVHQPGISLDAIEQQLRDVDREQQRHTQQALEKVSLQKLKKLRRRSR